MLQNIYKSNQVYSEGAKPQVTSPVTPPAPWCRRNSSQVYSKEMLNCKQFNWTMAASSKYPADEPYA